MTRVRTLGAVAALIAAVQLAPTAALAQANASPYTNAARYDAMRRLTGTISADPDGDGPLLFLAVRNSYDLAGRLIKVETGTLSAWQSEAVAPASWTGFTVQRSLTTSYDAMGRKTSESVREGAAGTVRTLTQFSYDNLGRLECTAVRMNPAAFASPPVPCALGTQGSGSDDFGPDRITRNYYDAAGQRLQSREGVGIVGVEAAVATWAYDLNGQIITIIDGNGNRATLGYDDHARQDRWTFPSTTRPTSFNDATQATALATAGNANAADYEEYGYDPNGNRTSFRKRDGSLLTFSYDDLNRVKTKFVPERASSTLVPSQILAAAQTRDVYYTYDLRNLQLTARFDSFTGEGITNAYDGFGRLTSTMIAMAGTSRTITHSDYDPDGNRREMMWPDLIKMSFGYDGLDRMDHVYEGALGSTVALATIAYNAQGLRSSMTRRYADATAYTYDPVTRLETLTESFIGNTGNTASTFTWLPSNQVRTIERSNDAYAWPGHVNVNRAYTANGLNQYSAAADVLFLYDANGNLIQSAATAQTPATDYVYDIENRLVKATGAVTANLTYDPLGRLFEVSGGVAGPTQLLYDGDELVAEYDGVTGTMINRYVHGAGVDDPIVWYVGSDLTKPRFLHTDHQGSITGIAGAITGASGALLAIDSYDEYGIPAAGNLGRFQYTGQAWIPELKMYYYKARFYSPTLGRFMQTDPIGYDDQFNLYTYVGNDPLNRTDPTGLAGIAATLEAWFAAGWGDGPNAPVTYTSVTAGASISRDGEIQVGIVTAVSERGAGLGAGATAGPSFQRGKLDNLANNNVTGVAGYGPLAVSASGRASTNAQGQPRLPMRDRVNHASVPLPSRIAPKVSAGATYGAALFDTTRSRAHVIRVNPYQAARGLIWRMVVAPITNRICNAAPQTCSGR